MIDAAGHERPVALSGQRRRHRRRHQARRRLKQLQLEPIRIGPHPGRPRRGDAEAGRLQRAGHSGPVVGLRQHAVVADCRHSPAGCADGDVANLSIGWQIAEQDEVAQRVAHGLLVQRGLEDPCVEPRRCRGIRHDDVEMFEAQVVERQRFRRRRLGSPAETQCGDGYPGRQRGANHHRSCCDERIDRPSPAARSRERAAESMFDMP